jgi:YbbR domain-containing protein
MPRAPRVLIHNWHLKLSALGLATFLWALVQTEPLSQETFSDVPVLVDFADTTWTISRPPEPSTVELRLGGPAREIIRLAREGTSVVVPVSSVGSRDTMVALQREWVRLGQRAGLTVESVSPPMVQLYLERAVSKTIPLAMRVRGELPSDLALSSQVAMNPQSAHVRGPESELVGLDSLTLVPFDLGRVRESGAFSVAVDTAGLTGVTVEPPQATLGVRVESLEERVLPSVPVSADVPAGSPPVVVDPPTIQLRLTGARTLVTAMDLSLLRVSLPPESLRGMQPGESRVVPIDIDGVPPLITAHPSTDAVTVRRASDRTPNAQRNQP